MRAIIRGFLMTTLAGCGGSDGPTTPPAGQPAKLAFIVQPTGARVGVPINPAVHVMLQDGNGNVVADSVASITLSINGGTGTPAALLAGTLTQTTLRGVAMFADVTVDAPGTGYSLSAVSGDVVGATSGGFDISPLEDAPVYVRLQSDAGDYIGRGGKYAYARENAVILVEATGNHLAVTMTGAQRWTAQFRAPDTLSRLEPGAYTGLQRFPFHDPAQGGLSWSGEGRGCNTLLGSFTIDSVTYEADSLVAIDLRFEQHCDEATPALRGVIHWTSGDTPTPPGPVNPLPAGLWRPAPGSTPASGNYVYLRSDAGDFIGLGQTYTYQPANSVITVDTVNDLSIRVTSAETWGGGLRAMLGLDSVQPGFYSDLWEPSLYNPMKGWFGWSGEARGCNRSLSWVAVDRIVYASGELTGLDLRFEQRCEFSTVALRGAVHWDR